MYRSHYKHYGLLFFLMMRHPPRYTLIDTLLPYTPLFRSAGSETHRPRRPRLPAPRSRALPLRSRYRHHDHADRRWPRLDDLQAPPRRGRLSRRSEEHTSELQSLMRNSYAVFCLKKKKKQNNTNTSLESLLTNSIAHE